MILDIMAIPLSQGLFVLVDGKNYEWLMQWKWFAHKAGNTFYAVRSEYRKSNFNRPKHIAMHREILGLKKGDGKQTDHINHCGLDNRETNLRFCTHRQNHQNRLPQGKTSKYKGVCCWRKKGKRWISRIRYNGQLFHIGCFTDEIKAAKAYDTKATELFGKFANTNF